jgi:hypothetical protein
MKRTRSLWFIGMMLFVLDASAESVKLPMSEGRLEEADEGRAVRFKKCGYTCPEGYHPTAQSCDIINCGTICPNQVNCEPNDDSFTTCGYRCPDGYHATSQSCDIINCGTICPNQVTCVRH